MVGHSDFDNSRLWRRRPTDFPGQIVCGRLAIRFFVPKSTVLMFKPAAATNATATATTTTIRQRLLLPQLLLLPFFLFCSESYVCSV